MPVSLKLMLAFVRKSPVRTILAALAMIVASSIVSWIVAGYDDMFAEFARKQTFLSGTLDAVLTITADSPEIDPVTVTKIIADPAVKISRIYTPVTRVNSVVNRAKTEKAAANMAEQASRPRGGGGRGGMGGGSRGGGGGRGGMGGGQLAPVVYGLPTGGGIPLQGTDAELPPFQLDSGRWLTATAPGEGMTDILPEAVLTEAAAEQSRAELGDTLTVVSNAGYFQLQVIGIMKNGPSFRSLAKLSSTHPNATMSGSSGIFTTWETADRISGGRQNAVTIQFNFISADAQKEFFSRWSEQVDREGLVLADSAQIDAVLQEPDSGRSRSMMEAYSATGLSILASFFIIFTTLSMGIDERLRQFAMLRIVALTRRQTVLLIFFESLMLGLIGWCGGLASGLLLQHFVNAAEDINLPLHIGKWTILLTGVCSMLGSAAAAVWPMIRVSRIRPVSGLAPAVQSVSPALPARASLIGALCLLADPLISIVPGLGDMPRVLLYSLLGVPLLAIGFICLAPLFVKVCGMILVKPVSCLFGLEPLFAASQFRSNFWRITGTVVSLSVGLGFYMMVLIWSSSMLIPYIPGKWMPELFLSVTPGGINEETAQLVSDLPGVNPKQCMAVAVEQVLLGSDVTGSGERESVVRQNNIVMIGVDAVPAYTGKDALFPFRFLTDKDAALETLKTTPYSCLLPHYFVNVATNPATGKRYAVGDMLDVIAPGVHGEHVQFKVAGIIEQNGWHWFSKMSGTRRNRGRTAAMVFANRAAMQEAFRLDRCEYFWMNLLPGADVQSVADGLSNLAVTNIGQTFHVAGMNGASAVGRQVVRSTTRDGLTESLFNRAKGMIEGMLQMPLLILLVVSISVANTALASIRARRVEIGMMRSIALSASGLFRLVLTEAMMIAITSTVISLLFGIIAGLCSAQMTAHSDFFGGMGWSFDVPWLRVLFGFGATTGLCILASLIPAWISGRANPLKLIRDGSSGL